MKKKLQKAIQETFNRRETEIPTEVPIALTKAFFEDKAKVSQWSAFLGKISDSQVPRNHLKVVNRLKEFLWPATDALNKNESFKKGWTEEKQWK